MALQERTDDIEEDGEPRRRVRTEAQFIKCLSADCGEIIYEADCLEAVRGAAGVAAYLSDAERQGVRTRLMEIIADNPSRAARIREVAAGAGLSVESR